MLTSNRDAFLELAADSFGQLDVRVDQVWIFLAQFDKHIVKLNNNKMTNQLKKLREVNYNYNCKVGCTYTTRTLSKRSFSCESRMYAESSDSRSSMFTSMHSILRISSLHICTQ